MNKHLTAATLGALLFATSLPLAACSSPAPQRVVMEECGIPQSDGSVLLVEDDLCEHRSPGVIWIWGGSATVVGGHYYRNYYRQRPPNVVIRFRDVQHGGSVTTATRIKSYGTSSTVRSRTGTTTTTRTRTTVRTTRSGTATGFSTTRSRSTRR